MINKGVSIFAGIAFSILSSSYAFASYDLHFYSEYWIKSRVELQVATGRVLNAYLSLYEDAGTRFNNGGIFNQIDLKAVNSTVYFNDSLVPCLLPNGELQNARKVQEVVYPVDCSSAVQWNPIICYDF